MSRIDSEERATRSAVAPRKWRVFWPSSADKEDHHRRREQNHPAP
ncbi:hypothetical protein [Paenibacillus polymyxa]|uniref:Uncharacterized protein n=1 Tax=Paenibacillus polymyxa TaxID=1406 RepID=A0AAP3ZX91_PAEPO|nr:hypothetical protein [Paenibacillus polymyxa]MDH2331043.1 hypothetical protein [Paenibacillus polymyxa]